MKTEYVKFKKNDIIADAYVTKALQIKITGKKEITKFIKDARDKFSKIDYKAMYKIKIKGDSDKFVIEPEDMKFKDFKAIMKDADPSKIKQLNITFYYDVFPELDEDEIEVLCKVLKKICEKYSAKVRKVLY